jgi:hypothetical protein
MNYKTLEKYCSENSTCSSENSTCSSENSTCSSENSTCSRSSECYKYTENLPRSTYELSLTPNGAVPNNPVSQSNIQSNPQSNPRENYISTTQTDNQPYSYGYPYAEYKWNLYNYYPKTNMSGVI